MNNDEFEKQLESRMRKEKLIGIAITFTIFIGLYAAIIIIERS